jgi:hypothetical protein
VSNNFRRAEVEPDLVVTGEMFELLEAALPLYVRDLSVSWDDFVDPMFWLLVPDPDCVGYKAEFVLFRDAVRTVKLNKWFKPDLRSGESPKPHGHPWAFEARLLAGGYTEHRYIIGRSAYQVQTHLVGDLNSIDLSDFHEVTEILDPENTLSLMVCGPGIQGNWGYLDPHTGVVRENTPDPTFRDRVVQLNPRRFSSN